MIDLTRHPTILRLLAHGYYRARRFLVLRDAGTRAAERHKAAFYERAWREAAEAAGARFRDLGFGVCEIGRGEALVRVSENYTEVDGPVTLMVASNKPLTNRLLAGVGLPTPAYAEFTLRDMAPAVAFLEAAPRECVVKPADGTGGGQGVTTGVRTRGQLAWAAAAAAAHGGELMIEEQAEGAVYRLLYLDGELLDAFTRHPPAVTGDGRSTVAGLVRRANEARLRHGSAVSQGLLTLSPEMGRCLQKQGLTLRSVPPAGVTVTLKSVVNENCGDENVTATRVLCESVVADGAKAARVVGVRLAGVDLITRDPGLPLAESGGVILEVNTPPSFYYHYHKRDGVFPVAAHVLERLLAGQPGFGMAVSCPPGTESE